ncbi:MAG: toxin-antitoxin system, toxin component, PIN family protein [Magnetospirillum sp.]|nr:MAG: toxin-antitoxin system, toxin component, PIN family protein [Magnetospirillum sp.]
MRFLIDECLHLSLVDVANAAGHEAHHVVRLGLQGRKDPEVMGRVRAEGFTLVTNNAVDFRRLYAREAIHAGLVVLLPQERPDMQRALFQAVFRCLGERDDLINKVIEVEIDGAEATIREYDLPPPQDVVRLAST